MRFLVLGAGLQGSACVYDLLEQADVESVTLADLHPDPAADFLPDDPRLSKVVCDFADAAGLDALIAGHHVVLSAAPYYFNGQLAALAVKHGAHYSDLGGNTEIVREQIALDDAARETGCTLVPDVGLAPGMVNVLAAEGVRRLDEPRDVRMYVGGLPQNPLPPLNYQVVYSLEGVLDYYTTPSWVLRDGRPAEVEALSEPEHLDFEGIGTLEAFHTAGGASLQPWEYEGELQNLSYKTLRYPGHADVMRAVRQLGLLSQDTVHVNGREVTPRDVFIACAGPLLTHADEPDLVALRVIARGSRDGRDAIERFDLLDYLDPDTGISAMERTTGFSLSIVGLFLGRGVIDQPGSRPSYRAIPYGPYIEELGKRGIEVREASDPSRSGNDAIAAC